MSFIKYWTKEMDQHLREFYREGCRVSPAILAMRLHMNLREVINRMAVLGIRRKRGGERY